MPSLEECGDLVIPCSEESSISADIPAISHLGLLLRREEPHNLPTKAFKSPNRGERVRLVHGGKDTGKCSILRDGK